MNADAEKAGKHDCFCDRHYGDQHDKRATCGDCPRDYIIGAWTARCKYLDEQECKQPNTDIRQTS